MNKLGIPIISLFTGGGLLDIGFEEAGFDIVWTNENCPDFADMYEYAMTAWRNSNGVTFPDANISNRSSITEITPENIMQNAFDSIRPSLFGIIGGPPCVDFSIAGNNKGANGANGRLVRVFGDLVNDLRPDFFVMENVPGLWKTRKHRSFLKKVLDRLSQKPCRYRISTKILNALELGVPQNRERLFVVGFLDERVKDYFKKQNLRYRYEWFPWPEPVYPDAVKQFPWPTKNPFGENPELAAGIPIELTVNPLLAGPPHPTTIANGNEFFIPYSTKFTQIDEGDDSRKSFKRLHRYRYSPTAWYGNNEVHLHPWEPRRLSVREALRIQTVPDTYILPEEYSLTSKFKLIANGVPCKLAQAIAESAKTFLQQANTETKLRLL
ncbi:DNA cytosine methyltransferase [Chloroflexota bacterium]